MSIQYVDACADVVGTATETFNIGASNDQLSLNIDGGGVQVFTLTHGATRTAAQVAADLAGLIGATAYAVSYGPQAGRLRIRTNSSNGAASSVQINAPANNANATLGLTAGTVTGNSRQNTTFIGDTKQNIINRIEPILNAAGWATISGSGSTNLLMQSALTPPGQNLQMRVRFKDNGGSCVQVSIENVAGTKAGGSSTTSSGNLLPAASKVFRAIANKFQAFIFTASPTAVREYVSFGVPALRTQEQGLLTEAIWLDSNSVSDADSATASQRPSFRTMTGNSGSGGSNQTGGMQLITLGNLWSHDNDSNGGQGDLNVATQVAGNGTGGAGASPFTTMQQWHNGEYFLLDAVIGWGLTAKSDAAIARGLLWDAVCASAPYAADLTTSALGDGHTWYVLTDNNVGSGGSRPQGGILLVVA